MSGKKAASAADPADDVSTPAAAVAMLAKSLGSYDGTGEVDAWLRCADIAFKFCPGLPDDGTRASAVILMLRGEAREFACRFPEDLRWNDMKERLRARFGVRTTRLQRLMDLLRYQQRDGERIQDYVAMFTRKLLDAEIRDISAELQPPVVAAFVNGLADDDVVKRLVVQDPDTLDKAIKLALQASGAGAMARGQRRYQRQHQPSEDMTSGGGAERREAVYESGGGDRRPRREGVRTKCWTCGNEGHVAMDCPEKRQRKVVVSHVSVRPPGELQHADDKAYCAAIYEDGSPVGAN